VTMPAGDLDGEIMAGLGAQPCPSRVDQQPAGLRSEPVCTGDAHGVRLRRCQIPAAATGRGHDHGGDREGTYGDPFGLRCTTSRRPRSATTRRSPENRPHAAPREGKSWHGRRVRMARTWDAKGTTPRNSVRVAGGRTRLLSGDWAPRGHQRPEELPWPSRASLERVSSYDPKAQMAPGTA
jgi:hypothetical protein